MELAEKQTTSLMKFQGRCWNCNKIRNLAKNCRCSLDHVCRCCRRMGHFAACCCYHQEHASTKNDKTSQRRTLQTRERGRGERVHAVSQQSVGVEPEDDAFYMFTASTSEALETLKLHLNDKIINKGKGKEYTTKTNMQYKTKSLSSL